MGSASAGLRRRRADAHTSPADLATCGLLVLQGVLHRPRG